MSSSLLRTCTKLCRQSILRNNQPTRLKTLYKAALLKDKVHDFSIEEIARKNLSSNQVRIQVHYCTVNSNDVPTFHEERKFPFTPGYEFGGEVIEIGKKVGKDQLMLGEKVVGLSLENMGGFAEECVISIDDVFRLPSNLQLKDAVILVNGHSLALLSFSKASIKKNDYVIVSAGTGGLGLAAIDMASNVYGAKVIGVVDSSEKAELVREIGAFKTVISDAKLSQHLLSALDKKPAKVVYDCVGGKVHEALLKCVAPGGQVFLASSHLYKNLSPPPMNTSVTVLDLLQMKKQDTNAYRCTVNDVLDLADQGLITAHVSASFNFKDINKGIEYIEEHKATGKVLICML
ncbi:hypothetical protein FQR65_LT09204 [Abscondita terminalis]|nr:hypothetical protein FQR65_LT09204 [Abscondita terminalis]